ncbi:MAG TPA: hypothetical protein DG942_07910 [Ruminococcaceae bacterium]|nr:hypothetical protein [Oscillospiraceae bacterium]
MITYSYVYRIITALICLIFILHMVYQHRGPAVIVLACALSVYAVEAIGTFLFPIVYDPHVMKTGPLKYNYIPFNSIAGYFSRFSAPAAWKQIFRKTLIFLPVGLLPPLISEKYRYKKELFPLIFITSLCIEMAQFAECMITQIPYRVIDIDDIILNFIGGVLGYLLFLLIRTVSRFVSER